MPTALIVEDEPEANRLLTLLVQLRGYRTTGALTGGDALELVERSVPDVVFLDLMLPDIDGYEVCRTIKANPVTCLVPVIIVSARLAEECRRRCYDLGAHAFIPKPYVPEQIFEALASADAWNRELAHGVAAGEIPLDSSEEDYARGITRLRGLLVARTPLTDQSAARIVNLVETIREEARDYAGSHHSEPVATVSYAIEEDRLTLAIRGHGDWFRQARSSRSPVGLAAKIEGVFDESTTSETGLEAILTKRFSPPANA